MLKQLLAIILLSILVITCMWYAQQGLQAILTAHAWISDMLKQVFSGGEAGDIIRQLIALLTMPLLIAAVPALIYWLVRHHGFPYFMEIVWVVWLMQTAALIVIYKVA